MLLTMQKEEANLLKPEIPLKSVGSGYVAPFMVQQPFDSYQHQLQRLEYFVVCIVFMQCLLTLTGFSKHFHIQNLHRLLFTWMGVIFMVTGHGNPTLCIARSARIHLQWLRVHGDCIRFLCSCRLSHQKTYFTVNAFQAYMKLRW